MKKYIKPQFEKLEITDIIAVSNIFEGIADLDNSSVLDWKDIDPNDYF